MRQLTILALGLFVTAAQPRPSAPRFEVTVDTRIELMAIVARLAGFQQYDTRTLPQHAAAVDTYFAPYKQHPAVIEARRLEKERNFYFDSVMSFAIHLTPLPDLKPRRPFEGSQLERLTPEEARNFAGLVAAFAKDSKADRFFEMQKPAFDAAVRRTRAIFDSEVDRAWFSAFFGSTADVRGILTAAFNNGQVAYGVRYYGVDGTRETYAVMNVLQLDEDGLAVFSAAMVPTIVHEFNHSYVNPVVEKHMDSIRASGEKVMTYVEAQMKGLGYSEIRTLFSESLVRAAVVRYKQAQLGDAAAKAEVVRQELKGFLWMGDLVALLGKYESERTRYKDFDAFFPEIVNFFNELEPRMPAVVAAFEARRPRLIDMTPAFGANDVDPATTQLVFRFDRQMRNSWAVIPAPKGQAAHPEVSLQAWDPDRKVFTMTVKLKPGTTYEFSLNTQMVSGFFSEEGVPLNPVPVKFTTRVGR